MTVGAEEAGVTVCRVCGVRVEPGLEENHRLWHDNLFADIARASGSSSVGLVKGWEYPWIEEVTRAMLERHLSSLPPLFGKNMPGRDQ